MTPNLFGNRYYGYRYPAWHELGIVSEIPMSGVDALTALGGGYYFEMRPVHTYLNGELKQLKDLAIIRSATPDDPSERVFGYATGRYHLFQPLDAVELFDAKVGEPVETLGFLGAGERMFVTWRLEEFEVNKGDTIDQYGFLALGFDAKMGAILSVVSKRVVCENTWNVALAQANNEHDSRGRRIFSGKHTSKNLVRDLGAWMNHITEETNRQNELTKSFFKKLVEAPLAAEKDVYELLFQAYPDPRPLPNSYPAELRKEKEEAISKRAESQERIRDGIYAVFSGEGTEITPDYYGLFNATTEYFNWGQPSKKAVEYSVLLGNRHTSMNKMANVLSNKLAKE